MLHRWAPIWSTITAISVTSMAGSVYLAQAPGLTDEMLQMWCKIRPDLCAGMQPARPAPVAPPVTQPSTTPPQQQSASSASHIILSSAAAASSSPSNPTTTVTVTAQDFILGLELKGPSEARIGKDMDLSVKIFNRTTKQQTDISYSMVLPISDTSTLRPGQGCAISGRTLTCSNLVIPANSSFFTSFRVPVNRDSCTLPSSLPVTVQKMSALGSVESSVSAILRWTWNCTYEPIITDTADVTAITPSYALSDEGVSMPVTIKNKNTTPIGYRIVLDLPAGVTPDPLPGCGQAGPKLVCFGDAILAGGAQFTKTFGRLKFSRELCGQTVQFNPIHVEASTSGGPTIIYGRTLTPFSIPVECGPVTSTASSSSAATFSSAVPSSVSSASTSVPLDRFSITHGSASCITADCRTVSVPLALRNAGPTPATRVAMVVVMDKSWSSATLQGVSCLGVDINGTNERRFMCPGGFDLTVPAGSTNNYTITLTTSAPCPIANPRMDVLIQSAPTSVYEEDYSNNSVLVPLPRPCQPVVSSASSRPASSAASSLSAPDSLSLQSITIAGNYVRVDYTKNFDTCAHMLTTGGQITHAQNYFCKQSGPVTLSKTQFNNLFQATQSYKLCHGNNGTICSNTVTVTETPDVPVEDRNPLYLRFPIEGQWNFNPNPCYTDDCRKIVMPLEFGNKNAAPSTVMISGVVGSMWNTMTVKGLTCELRTNTTADGKTYTCPSMTIPANTAGYTVGVVLTSTTPCPVANADFVHLAFTGALKTAQQFPSDISRSIPLPCGTVSQSASSAAGTAGPDLSVQVDATAKVIYGERVHYKITATNRGNAPAHNVKITDVLPASFNSVGVSVLPSSTVNNSSSNVTCTDTHSKITECTVKDFPAGGSITIDVELTAVTDPANPNPPYCPYAVTNTAGVSIEGGESNTANNTSPSVKTDVVCPEMSFSLAITSVPLASGTPQTIKAKKGDSMIFDRIIQEKGIVDRRSEWNWNSSMMDCAAYPETSDPSIRCTVIADGQSSVSLTTKTVMADGVERTVTSNSIAITTASAPSSSAPIVCGNGIVQAFEICDDGNRIDTDSCRNNCTINFNPQTCGNGIREGTEPCDDGNQNETDTCTSKCTTITSNAPICGDGIKAGAEECDDGNRIDTDSCSASCGTVPAQQAGKLTLTQLALPSATALSGQSNIPVMRFSANADADSLLIQSLNFNISQTNPNPLVTFSLWRDTNADGIVDTKVSDLTQSGYSYATGLITGMGGHVETGADRLFEVHAAIGSTIAPYTGYYNIISRASFAPVSVKALIGNVPLRGEQVNGTCTSYCGISIRSADSLSPAVTVYKTGTLFVSRLYPFTTQTLKRGELGPSALNFLLEARKEDISVTRIQFSVPVADASAVDHIDLYEKGGTTAIGTATASDCFSGASDNSNTFCLTLPKGTLVIPAGGNKSLEARPFIKAQLPDNLVTHTIKVALQNALPAAYMMNIYTECGAAVCAVGMTSNNPLSKSDSNGKDTGEVIIGTAAAFTPLIDRNVEGAIQNISRD